MTEVARKLSDIDDTPERNFCTEFCFVIHTMEFQLCSEYLIQLHSYACDHEPHTHTHILHSLIIAMTRFLQMCVGFVGMQLSQIR